MKPKTVREVIDILEEYQDDKEVWVVALSADVPPRDVYAVPHISAGNGGVVIR